MTGLVRLASAEHRVDAGFGVEPSAGVLLSLELAVDLTPRWRLGGWVELGSLEAKATGAVDRDVGALGVAASLELRPWLALVGRAGRRSYSTPLARQGWTTVSLGAEARVPFANRRVQAVASTALLPVVAVSGLPGPDLALAAGAGMNYRLGSASVEARYALERYDFPRQGAARRLEQLSSLSIALRVPLRRA
ncbi:MAG: hypothetical protein ACREL9_07560 [Gemmatimonadales bacterium]